MHIFCSGIGSVGIGPLALMAHQAGYTVTGSDKQSTQYLDYLKQHGITDIYTGQTREQIAAVHQTNPIDWFVYTSALPLENPHHPELVFCQEQGIKTSKRDKFLNTFLQEKQLQLIAIAGTHGKTTTTAMTIWLLKRLGIPVSYTLAAKVSFGDMGEYAPDSHYFVYEADEFDHNFLAFKPYFSLISGVSWDHHEIYPTREEYRAAFREFITQSQQTLLWQNDATYLKIDDTTAQVRILNDNDVSIDNLKLMGHYNRLDGWLAVQAIQAITHAPDDQLTELINDFPGLQKRMEQIAPGLFSDEAHTPDKIRGGLSAALEIAALKNQPLIVIYEPLTNRRQHYMLNDYQDCFKGAQKVYWLPSYLAREDPSQRVIPPAELISHLADPSIALPAEKNDELKQIIQRHLAEGAMVVGMAGGGGGSLDEWLRQEFPSN
jgi:UDP-N-acetylmuramate--alanine ligase